MLVKTYSKHDFTLFYFDKHGSYSNLLNAINIYIDNGTTTKELFFFAKDAQFITPEQVKKIVPIAAKAAKVRKSGGKTALMYERISLYGLGRIYKIVEDQIIKKTWETKVFKNFNQSLEWLNISEKIIVSAIKNDNNTTPNMNILYLKE